MRKELISYLSKITIFTLVLAIAGIVASMYLTPLYFSQLYFYILLVVVLTTILYHAFILRSLKKGSSVFIRTIMIATVVKLFSYLIFIAVLMYLDRANALKNALTLMFFYITYLAFEIVQLMKTLRNIK